MTDFLYLVRITAPDVAHADLVLSERVYFEEELTFAGDAEPFEYQIDLATPEETAVYVKRVQS